MPKVFISYSHDSKELEDEVRRLADTLIEYGVETEIDQYTTNPENGWAQYMLENILKSDYILCVCTENYKKRFENEEKIGVGLGAKFEGKHIQQILYSDECNAKVLPILFSDTQSIPMELQPYTYYKLYENREFEKLYRYITNQPSIRKPELGSKILLKEYNSSILENVVFENSKIKGRKKNSIDSTKKLTDIDEALSITSFFDNRMAKAFPGIRKGEWVYSAEKIINCLKIILREPLNNKSMRDPIWWFRGGKSSNINYFEIINSNKCIIGKLECAVDKIFVYRGNDYYRSFIYVELKPESPVDIYENSEDEIERKINNYGYAWEEYAVYNGYPITRYEYDDGAAFINGEHIELDIEAKLRMRYLSKYNFIICAKFNPINSLKEEERFEEILKSIIKDESKIEKLVDAIEKLPKNRNDFY